MTDSNRDKRARVEQTLRDPDTAHLSSRAIAERLGVSPDLVSRMRLQVSQDDTPAARQAVRQQAHATSPDRTRSHPPLTGDVLLSAGCSPRLAQRIARRLAAMPDGERHRVERMLTTLFL